MKLWKNEVDVAALNQISENSLTSHLGIEFIECGDDYIKATMPVDHRTIQPMGLLHGGASAVLSETLGSIASTLCININDGQPVGVEINANHLRSAKSGYVTGIVKPIKIGKTIHVWNTEIFDTESKLICVSRLTVMIIKRNI